MSTIANLDFKTSEFEHTTTLVFEYLNNGDTERALQTISQLEAYSNNQKRRKIHYEAQIYMRLGNYQIATTKLTAALSLHGSHIAVLMDLAVCYYCLDQFNNWKITLNSFDKEFNICVKLLSPSRIINTGLQRAKFDEEMGQIDKALSIYKNLLQACSDVTDQKKALRLYPLLLSQIVRIQGQYSITDGLAQQYQELLLHSVNDTDLDCAFEVEHALILAELRLFGNETAFLRLNKILNNPLCRNQESNLLILDLAFEFMIQKNRIPSDLKSKILEIQPSNSYEKQLLLLITENHIERTLLQGPLATSIRILALICKQNESAKEALKQLSLLIESLPAKSQKIWLKYLKYDELQQNSAVTYDINKKILYHGGQFCDLSKTESYSEIIDLLSVATETTSADLIQKLWRGDGTEADVSRLRMRIKRLNSLVHRELGITNLLVLTKSKVCLSVKLMN
jgi:hypothetical protein